MKGWHRGWSALRPLALAVLISIGFGLKARADDALSIPFQIEQIAEHLEGTRWQAITLGDDTLPKGLPGYQITISYGRFIVPTPCGIVEIPTQPVQLNDRLVIDPAPCIAIHTPQYDIVHALQAATTITLLANGDMYITGDGPTVLLRLLP